MAFSSNTMSWDTIKNKFSNASFIRQIRTTGNGGIVTLRAGYYEFPYSISPIGTRTNESYISSLYRIYSANHLTISSRPDGEAVGYIPKSLIQFYYSNYLKNVYLRSVENFRGFNYYYISSYANAEFSVYYALASGRKIAKYVSFDENGRVNPEYKLDLLGERYKYIYIPADLELDCTNYTTSNDYLLTTDAKNSIHYANFCVFLANCDANNSNSGVKYYESDPWAGQAIPGIDIVLEKKVVASNGAAVSQEVVDSELGAGFKFDINLYGYASGGRSYVFDEKYSLATSESTTIIDERSAAFYLVTISEPTTSSAKYEMSKVELAKGVILSDGTYSFGSPSNISSSQYQLNAANGNVYKFTITNRLTDYVPPEIKLQVKKRTVEYDGTSIDDGTSFTLYTSINGGAEKSATLKTGGVATYDCQIGDKYSIREDAVAAKEKGYTPDSNPITGEITQTGTTVVEFINRERSN